MYDCTYLYSSVGRVLKLECISQRSRVQSQPFPLPQKWHTYSIYLTIPLPHKWHRYSIYLLEMAGIEPYTFGMCINCWALNQLSYLTHLMKFRKNTVVNSNQWTNWIKWYRCLCCSINTIEVSVIGITLNLNYNAQGNDVKDLFQHFLGGSISSDGKVSN